MAEPTDVLGGAYVKTPAELLTEAVNRAEQAEATAEKLLEQVERTEIEMPAWPTADRIRDIYEQITDDLLNGRTSVPPLKERLAISESHATALGELLNASTQHRRLCTESTTARLDAASDAARQALYESDGARERHA